MREGGRCRAAPALLASPLRIVHSSFERRMGMEYALKPLTNHGTGAEIRGVDLTQTISAELRARLNADFARYHVLAIRDQKLSPDEFMQAGRVFGDLMPHHRKSG